jgi:hypothetical protein
MHAGTVEVLVNKAHLEPDVAVAFAEAFDMANSQLVTVPVMDARFAAVEAKMDRRFSEVDSRFAALDAKIDVRFAAVDARFETLEARMDAKIEKCRADLVRWVFLVMLGNVALSAGATAVLNFLQRAH